MHDTATVRTAIKVAAHAHRHANRKGTETPYIAHPCTVLLLLSEVTTDEATLAAGVLHDVIEDCGDEYDQSRLRQMFGDTITDTVLAVTKDDTIRDWRARNEDYLVQLRRSGNQRAWLVSAADKVSNLTDVLEDYQLVGDKLWDRFNAGPQAQLWWYDAVSRELADLLPHHALTQRLQTLVSQLETVVSQGERWAPRMLPAHVEAP